MKIRPLIAACMTLAAIAVAAPASASADPLLGFNDNFGIGDMERSVALTQQHFGVKTNRLFVRWDWMEKKPGQYDFVMSDRSYATLKAAGQRPTYVIVGTPEGTVPGNGAPFPVPPDPTTMKRVADLSGGRFYNVEDGDRLSEIYKRLGAQIGSHEEQREISVIFAAAGLAALLAALALSVRRAPALP